MTERTFPKRASALWLAALILSWTPLPAAEEFVFCASQDDPAGPVTWRNERKAEFETRTSGELGGDSYTVAEKADGSALVVRTVATPSGDWVFTLRHHFKADGNLLLLSTEFRTFSGFDPQSDDIGPTRIVRRFLVARDGELRKISEPGERLADRSPGRSRGRLRASHRTLAQSARTAAAVRAARRRCARTPQNLSARRTVSLFPGVGCFRASSFGPWKPPSPYPAPKLPGPNSPLRHCCRRSRRCGARSSGTTRPSTASSSAPCARLASFAGPPVPRVRSSRTSNSSPRCRDCIQAGYRACKRCHPLEVNGAPPEWIRPLIERVETDPSQPLRATELRDLGLTPERVRRWFLTHHGMTFASWCRGRRLARAFTEIRAGDAIEDAMLANGFASHSGFDTAFKRAFGEGPRPEVGAAPVFVKMIQSPLGPMVAAAGSQGLAFLEFADRRMLETNFAALRRQMRAPVVPGTNAVLEQAERELNEYFAGQRRTFRVPLDPRGTGFQLRVWEQLRGIPHAETIPYDELARRIGQPTAMRAVAQANGCNKLAIVIPCHRVIGKDGSLTGYGGGVWRKRLLLELERTGASLLE